MRTILITGAGSGLGEGAAIGLAARGHRGGAGVPSGHGFVAPSRG
jgi:NAD(P)-dependent dehydrogenase (short-subunit alcohol dehydrogenase family)